MKGDTGRKIRTCCVCGTVAPVRRGFSPLRDGSPIIVAIAPLVYLPGRDAKGVTLTGPSVQVCTACLAKATQTEPEDRSLWTAFSASIPTRCTEGGAA